MNLDLSCHVTEGTPDEVLRRYASLPQRAEESNFGTYDENVVVVDTETTGVSLKKDELTQIAAARLDRGRIVEWYVTFVNPGMPIPDEIAHLTHIHDADVEDAPSPEEALAGLVEFVGDAKLVAHNAEFDRNFTTKHPAGYPLLENTWIDSLELSRIALPRMKSHRLIDLVRAFGAPLSTHRADDDVAALCAVYRILLAAVDAMPEGLLHSISQLATPEEWPTQPLFAAFANRAFEQRVSACEDNPSAPMQPEIFSLKQARRARLPEHAKRSKLDAGDMVSMEVLEQSSARIDREAEGMAVLTFPSAEEVAEAFAPDGLLGALYEDYETREEQAQMALAVRDAFASSQNLCVEAGTGVGKSMAYLIPAAYTALKNNIAVGIATKTNALLDQLVYKELPLLAKELGKDFSSAALKGFSHYPCLRKVQRLMDSGAQMRTVMNEEKTQAPAIAGVLSFIEQTAYDDMDTLKVDFRLLPRTSISTTSHECLRRKCPFFGQSCFVFGARKLAESADIVVTNQSLFFCDVAAEGSLLPPIRYWVVDEAHGAEAEARGALALEIGLEALDSLAARVGIDANARNVFVRAERKVDTAELPEASARELAEASSAGEDETDMPSSEQPGTLFFVLLAKAKRAGRVFAEVESAFIIRVHDLLQFDPNRKSSYDMTDIWINDQVRSMQVFKEVAAAAKDLIDAAEALIRSCQELVALLDNVPHAAEVQREIAAVALELKGLVRALDVIFVNPTDEYVCSAYLNKRPDKGRGIRDDVIRASLYNVGSLLDETLYARTRSVVYTSATLTVNGSFEPFEHAMGLNGSEQSRADAVTLESSYDFDRNMCIYVVNDLAEPGNPKYLDQLKELLVKVHLANSGSLLTLFTNKKEMEACFGEVSPRLKENDLRLVCQKWGVSVKNLRDDFLTDETLSLFALKSFWEGFDAPGKTLKGVIIPKLPFIKPTDPLSCERAARDDAAWRHFVLPQAVLEMRQAAGRLIRRADDSGVLILADSRLVSKGYGKVFLRSLPSKNVRFVTTQELLEELEQAGA